MRLDNNMNGPMSKHILKRNILVLLPCANVELRFKIVYDFCN